MAVKFIAFFALIAAANAGLLPGHQVYQTDNYHQHHAGSYAAPPASTVVKAAVPVSYAHAPLALAHAQPVLTKHDNDYDPHPQYKFGYDVQDALSGDTKSQVEERDGDAVRGEYSLIDADGFKRIVQYTSDPVNGFNAVVNRVPLEHAQVKTVIKAAPVATYAAPPTYVKEYHNHHTIH